MATSLHWRETVGSLFSQLYCNLPSYFQNLADVLFGKFGFFLKEENIISHGSVTSHVSSIAEFYDFIGKSREQCEYQRKWTMDLF